MNTRLIMETRTHIVHFCCFILGMDMESHWNDWMDAVVSFSHLLATVNSSLNFVIYCYKDNKFRQSLCKMFAEISPCFETCDRRFGRRRNGFTSVATAATNGTTLNTERTHV